MFDLSLAFDAHSLAVIARMLGFEALLDAEIATAVEKSADYVATTAQDNTWIVFENPTGDLADSIQVVLNGPRQADITVGVPYGRRREEGFSGMTDSLGRYFAHDPGKPYMQPAADSSHDQIALFFTEATLHVIGIVGA